jgi:hypothetical protein
MRKMLLRCQQSLAQASSPWNIKDEGNREVPKTPTLKVRSPKLHIWPMPDRPEQSGVRLAFTTPASVCVDRRRTNQSAADVLASRGATHTKERSVHARRVYWFGRLSVNIFVWSDFEYNVRLAEILIHLQPIMLGCVSYVMASASGIFTLSLVPLRWIDIMPAKKEVVPWTRILDTPSPHT